MNPVIILLSFTIFSTHALYCRDNPCALGGYFAQKTGYQCVQLHTQALCTCPNEGYEIDQPCRVCNRTNPSNNPCGASPSLITCLETDDFGTAHACLCSGPSGPAVTTAANCDLTVTLTSTTITTITPNPPVTQPPCFNGGYFVDSICHCPSGFDGTLCEHKFDGRLCERIVCHNRGVCAIRNPSGPYQSVCLCRYGISGDYCQLIGTLGFCEPGLCMNNALCKEEIIGSTRHAYCDCLPGYNGIKCENQYFTCTSKGRFVDNSMSDQGKYFECTEINGYYQLEQKSCSKGLRFNANKNMCTY